MSLDNESILDSIFDANTVKRERRTEIKEAELINTTSKQPKQPEEEIVAVEAEVVPASPETTVVNRLDIQKNDIQRGAFNEMQRIISDPDVKDKDKISLIKTVVDPHYPKTTVSLKGKIEDMSNDDLVNFISGFSNR